MLFNGLNEHSIVVLDNCSIHHVDGIVEMIQEVGALVHFLPPYSPDMMPIEEAFSKVKAEMKKIELCTDDIETVALNAFCTITPDDCKGWIMNGIYNQL